jgi:thiamine pyrophosphokinase
MLGVWGVLARNADAAPRLVEDAFESRILACEGCDVWEIEDCEGATLSVVSLSGDSHVTERGMRWELDGERLGLLDDRGLSNYVVRDDALIRCDKGTIAAFVVRD